MIDTLNETQKRNAVPLSEDDVRKEIQARQTKTAPFMLLSGYEGANPSPARGYVYWPGLDSRRELSGFSDAEIRRRIKWLYANFGVARRIVRGLAKMLGIQTPQPTTPDDEWNELVFDHFVATAGSPLFFDRRGRFDFFTAQPVINRHRFKDGRMFAAFVDTPSRGARLAFYEAHQLRTPPGRPGSEIWVDGVHLDRFDRPIAYGLRDGQNPSIYGYYPAGDGIYYANWDSFGSIHGISVLAHAVCNMIDVVELRGLRKHAAKNAAQMAPIIEKDRAVVTSGGGIHGPLITQEIDVNGETQEIQWELMTQQGAIPRLDPGEKIKIVADDRPTQNNLEFDKALIEDCILGVDLPPSVLYHLAKMTGPEVRFAMEDVRRWILIEQRPQATVNQRYYSVWLAKEIKAGRIPEPRGVPYWRQVSWIGQPDMTIDRGRDGALAITQLDAGLTTWGDQYALAGAYGPRKLREKVREVAMIKREIARAQEEFDVPLTLAEVIPRMRGLESSPVEPRETPDDHPDYADRNT